VLVPFNVSISILHRLFDAWIIWFDLNGVLCTTLSPQEQEQLGIKSGSCLVSECMNAQCKEYLGRRINDANQFVIAKNMKKSVHKASHLESSFYALVKKQNWNLKKQSP
jgi:hypothetical protein